MLPDFVGFHSFLIDRCPGSRLGGSASPWSPRGGGGAGGAGAGGGEKRSKAKGGGGGGGGGGGCVAADDRVALRFGQVRRLVAPYHRLGKTTKRTNFYFKF